MKRKIIETVVILLCLLGGFYFYANQYEKKTIKDLALENIDALAAPEGYPDENFCCDKDNNRIIMALDDDMQFAYLDLNQLTQ